MMTDTRYLSLLPINRVQMKKGISVTVCLIFNLSKYKISSRRILDLYTGVGMKKKETHK